MSRWRREIPLRWLIMSGVIGSLSLMGCSIKLVKRSPGDLERIAELNEQLAQLQQLTQTREEETEQLRRAKMELERQLAKEIGNRQVSVGMDARGLVVTFVAEVLFDSGKAKLRSEALPTLEKISKVLQRTVPEQLVGIEGHTDNEPIKYSGWRSNWELSTARATSVLHYLVDERKMAPQRVSATGYGEYHPVAANDTVEGRQKNRRVEIVILPQAVAQRSTTETALPSTGTMESEK